MNDFYELSIKHGPDKSTYHGYHYFYPKHLEHLRGEYFNMLEIGYQGGHSCRMWEEYFRNANVFAMDIGVEGRFDNHFVFRGDQSNIEDLRRVVREIGSARFIIDDGSHHPIHQIETFNILFSELLEQGGVYIIEDIECNYWRQETDTYGYRIGPFNAVDYTKNLIDHVNSEYTKKNNSLGISSISYGQNCIILTKQTEDEKQYFNRQYRFEFNL